MVIQNVGLVNVVTDWDLVEQCWRKGFHSKTAICEEFGITRAQLNQAIETRGWTQVMLSAEMEASVMSIAQTARFPADSLMSDDDVKRQVLMTAGQIVKVHRDDVAKLRKLTMIMTDRLEEFLHDGSYTSVLGLIGEKESASHLLDRLSKVMVRAIELERKSYGLDSMTVLDNDGDEQMQQNIKMLTQRLTQITEEKAQRYEAPVPVEETEESDAE